MKLNAGVVGVDDTRPPDLQVREYGWATLELNDVAYIPLSNPKGDIHALVTPGTSNPDESSRVKERYRYTDYGLPIIEPIAFSGVYSASLSVSYNSGTDQTTITDSNLNNGDWDLLTAGHANYTMRADIFGDVADFPIVSVTPGGQTTTVIVQGDARAAAIGDYWEIEDTRALQITVAPTTTGTGTATLTVLTLDAIPTRDGSKSGTAAEDDDLVGQVATLNLDTLATAVIVKNEKTAQKLYLRGDWTGLLAVDKFIKVHPRASSVGNTSLFVGESGYQWDGSFVTVSGAVHRLPNLYNVHNRFYSPEWGRWLQRDPIGIHEDATNLGNGYTYAGNSPASAIDPSGLGGVDPGLAWRMEEHDPNPRSVDAGSYVPRGAALPPRVNIKSKGGQPSDYDRQHAELNARGIFTRTGAAGGPGALGSFAKGISKAIESAAETALKALQHVGDTTLGIPNALGADWEWSKEHWERAQERAKTIGRTANRIREAGWYDYWYQAGRQMARDYRRDPAEFWGKVAGDALVAGALARARNILNRLKIFRKKWCFVAGTPVLMADGSTKPIEDVVPGDVVLSKPQDEPDAEPVASVVVRTFQNVTETVVWLTLSDSGGRLEALGATPEHPFFVIDTGTTVASRGDTKANQRGWVRAADLRAGYVLITPTGDRILVLGVRAKQEHRRTYNFEVGPPTTGGAATHTYFAGTLHTWTHNDCTPGAADDILEGAANKRPRRARTRNPKPMPRGVNPEQTVEQALKGTGQIPALRGNPGLAGLDRNALLRMRIKDVQAKLTPQQWKSFRKHFEGRDLRHGK